MTNGRKHDKRAIYDVRVKGRIRKKWSDYWFEGFKVTLQQDDVTLLTGLVADQAALHSLLTKIRDLGLPLLSVQRLDCTEHADLLDRSTHQDDALPVKNAAAEEP